MRRHLGLSRHSYANHKRVTQQQQQQERVEKKTRKIICDKLITIKVTTSGKKGKKNAIW